MTNENKVLVIWQCDKKDCGHVNRRWVETNCIIFDDICEACDKRIHEPITETIEAREDTHD